MNQYIIFQGDGMPDLPIKSEGGKTPLMLAKTPNMDFLASKGQFGLVKTIPDGFEPQSDIGNLSLLGYNPREVYTGRSPIEAASRGIKLDKHDVSFRLNLVTFDDRRGRWFLDDFSAGHIEPNKAQELVNALGKCMDVNSPFEFHTGLSYRHTFVWRGGRTDIKLEPPHNLQGRDTYAFLPKEGHAKCLVNIMERAREILEAHTVNQELERLGLKVANGIWLWGQGVAPKHIKPFEIHAGFKGAAIAAVDLVRGIARLAKIELIEVAGATGFIDTNYEGKGEAALKALEDKYSFVFVHVEAPDEAGHMGSLKEKILAIERFDSGVVGKVVKNAYRFDNLKIMVVSDHRTPIATKTHSSHPVPFAIWNVSDSVHKNNYRKFEENTAAQTNVFYSSGPELFFNFIDRQSS